VSERSNEKTATRKVKYTQKINLSFSEGNNNYLESEFQFVTLTQYYSSSGAECGNSISLAGADAQSQGWLHQNLLRASDRNKAPHKINRRTVRFYSNDAVTTTHLISTTNTPERQSGKYFCWLLTQSVITARRFLFI